MLAKIALGNVRRSIKDFAIFFLTLALGVCIFYAFGSLKDQTAVIDLTAGEHKVTASLLGIFDGVSVFVAVVLGFLVVYANRFLVRRRKREFGIYLTLGMSRVQVACIIVAETLLVGAAALVTGLVLGVGVSQAMLYVTARLFKTTVKGFSVLFSPSSCATTCACFAVIFAVSLALDVALVSRCRLIDLIYAEKRSEKLKLRSVPLCVACFIVAVALIGVAYHLLVRSGLIELGADFGWATLLVIVGTALLFFSASGFILRAIQRSRGVYLRGLNMFVLRQLNCRINTAWVSITLVCAMLFMGICGICTGFGVARAVNTLIDHGTSYDLSLVGSTAEAQSAEVAAGYGYDALAALRSGVDGWDQMVADAVEVDFYQAQSGERALVADDLWRATDYDDGGGLVSASFRNDSSAIDLVKMSDYNDLRRMRGLDPVDLGADGCAVWCDDVTFTGFWEAFLAQNETVDVLGRTLRTTPRIADEPLYNYLGSTCCATLIVPDSLIEGEGLTLWFDYVNVTYAGESAETDLRLREAVDAFLATLQGGDEGASTSWPAFTYYASTSIAEQANGLSVTVSYLAVYIGLVLLISCATVLAIQQLSEASDNVGRYRVLSQLGACPRSMGRALAAQIGVYFAFPLAVALCHATCALYVVNDTIVGLFGCSMTDAFLLTAAFVLVVYGGYFALTYKTSKEIVLSPSL